VTGWRERLAPDLVGVLDRLPVVDFVDHETFRAASDAAGAARAATVDTSGLEVDDREVDGVRVRLYRPVGGGSGRPAVLHLHGGGFVSGSPDSSHAQVVPIARELGAVVVSVDYRRAPEHPYPAPLDDCVTALRWLVAHADELGVDRDRVAVHGVSAGGNLAAAVALRVRGEVPLCFQFLSIPITDDRLETASQRELVDTPIWTRSVGEVSWRHYLGPLSTAPVLAAPGRASVEELRGLPPAYVAVMELDPLCDEGLEYAARLAAAGVPVEAHRFPGAFHGAFSSVPEAWVSRRYLAEELEVLRRALGC
jgi:acetyl esterase